MKGINGWVNVPRARDDAALPTGSRSQPPGLDFACPLR
jgi:hypothetical protein